MKEIVSHIQHLTRLTVRRVSAASLQKHQYLIIDSTVFLLIICFSWLLMHHSFQYKDGQMIILGRIWSDFGAHIPLIRSFSLGQNFPNVEYPTFPGEPIRYHYLFFFFVGLLEKIGLNIALALNLFSAAGMILLLSMIYLTTLTLSKSRLAGIFALILFLFNSTLSWLEVLKTSANTNEFIDTLLTAQEFASFGPWDGKHVSAFWNWNIFINQRHLAFGLGLTLFILYPLVRFASTNKKTERKLYPIEFICIYIGWLIFPLLHQAGYVMAVIGAVWWMAIGFFRIQKKVLFIYAVSIGMSLFTYQFLTVHPAEPPALKLGYLASEQTVRSIAEYWFYNVGLYVFLVPIAWLLSARKVKAFWLPFFGFFILANTFQLSTDLINNHKLINFFIIGCNILLGIFFARVSRWKPQLISIPLVALAILSVTFSGIMDISPIVNNSKIPLDDYPRSPIQQWIKENTAKDSIFITNHYFYNPASIVGRKLFLDYGYFNWSMGYPDGERRETLMTFYSPEISPPDLCRYLSDNNLDYIYLFNVEHEEEFHIKESVVFQTFTPLYTEEDSYIYSVAQNCQQIVQ